MAKEFDAYLKSRLMECDVAVSSIPYRDGIDIVSGLLLEGVVEDLALQKYLAMETGSELMAEIDGVLKTCYQRLNESLGLDASVNLAMSNIVSPEGTGIVLGADVTDALLTYMAHGESGMAFGAVLTGYEYAQSSGRLQSGIALSMAADGVASQKAVAVNSAAELLETVSLFVRKFIPGPIGSGVRLVASCDVVAGHYRKLAEIDDRKLADLDSMTLGEIDFEITT